MTVLGIDYGMARIGLALGDPATRVASPWKVLQNRGRIAAVAQLAEIVAAEGIERIVVGYPKTMRGEEGHMAHMIDEFVADLREAVDVPITLEDERLSSQQADRDQAGGAAAGRDALAAAHILEANLERRT